MKIMCNCGNHLFQHVQVQGVIRQLHETFINLFVSENSPSSFKLVVRLYCHQPPNSI